MTSPASLARPGDIVRLASHDYFDGNTALTVRVADIDADLDHLRGLEWVHILAVEPDQPDVGPRPLVVRVTALRQPHAQPLRNRPGPRDEPCTRCVAA